MLARIHAVWEWLSALGTDRSTSDNARRIRMCNQVCLVSIANAVGFDIGYSIAGAADYWPMILCNLVAGVLFIACLALNHRGRHAVARSLVLFSINVDIFVISMLFSREAGLQYYFFAFGLAAHLVVPATERWTRILFAGLSLTLFILVVSTGSPARSWMRFGPTALFAVNLSSAASCLVCMVFLVNLLEAGTERAETALALERDRSEGLLLNILPSSISQRLKDGEGSIADRLDDVTVLFADIVGFTQLSAMLTPAELVSILDRVFSRFDELCESRGLEKIKTIGDAYMVAGGLLGKSHDHVQEAADLALDMRAALPILAVEAGHQLDIRIGIHTGSAVAGVIGKRKFAYDLWGDTVNTASRMESHGMPGRIHVSEAVHRRLAERYEMSCRGAIDIKGKGSMTTYFLEQKRHLSTQNITGSPGVGVLVAPL